MAFVSYNKQVNTKSSLIVRVFAPTAKDTEPHNVVTISLDAVDSQCYSLWDRIVGNVFAC